MILKSEEILRLSSLSSLLPHKWGFWNAGFTRLLDNQGYILAIRNETSKHNEKYFDRKVPPEFRWERYCPTLLRLDNDFRFLSARPSQVLGVEKHSVGLLEDVRLFNWNNEIYATGTRKEVDRVNQFLGKLVEDTIIPFPFYHPFTGLQKNWNPIPHSTGLYFEQSCLKPRKIVKYNTINKHLDTIYDRMYGIGLRGNSQVAKIDGKLLSLYHYHQKRDYYHIFGILNPNPPFELEKLSIPFKFGKTNIEFGMGLENDGEDFLISYGIQDSDNAIIKVFKKNILNLF